MGELNIISGHVVDSAYRIHSKFGPGMHEVVYERIIARDLRRLDYRVERQKWISFEFEGMWFRNACRADLIVEDSLVIEVKSAAVMRPAFSIQLLTYLRLLDLRLGLVLNFGAPVMKDGIKRVINGY